MYRLIIILFRLKVLNGDQMKKKSLYKDIFREIKHSFGRFLSITILLMLGVAFFVGLKAVGPDMLLTATRYFERYNLADVDVQSTYGLDESDVELLKNVEGIEDIEFSYTADVLLENSNVVAKVYSTPMDGTQTINTYEVKKGHLPKETGEVAIDEELLSRGYKIGDQITFINHDGSAFTDTFQETTFTIVGIVDSPKYIENTKRGNSTFGDGIIDGFAVITEDDFQMNVYTLASIVFQHTQNVEAYSSEYENKNTANTETVEEALTGQGARRLAAMKEEAQIAIDEAKAELQEGKQELANQENKLADAKQQLENAKAQYKQNETDFYNQLAEAEEQIAANEQELANAKMELDAARQQIAEGQTEIQSGENQLSANEAELAAAQAQLNEQKIQLEQAGLLYGDALAEITAAQEQLNAQKSTIANAQQELAVKEEELATAKANLAQYEADYENGQSQLAAAKEEYENNKQNGLSQLADAEAQLETSEAEYDQNESLFNEEKLEAEKKFAEAEKEIAAAIQSLSELEEPTYYVLDRSDNPGYTEFKENADRLTSLSTVFPVLFFLVAILVCLTTMTRMVEEQRSQIGLLKALGYGNYNIMEKYLWYGTLASCIGAFAGLVIGFELLPRIIYDAYSIMYGISNLTIAYYPYLICIAFIAALLCTSLTAVIVTWAELKENAAILMRPKAPKSGKRILLERIPFIWKRLNFTGKVTARNIFRYKKRMFMTVFGVAGCTALIFTGFSLRGSINDLVPLQYEEVMTFDAMITHDVNASDEALAKYESILQKSENITSRATISQTSVIGFKKRVSNQDITIVVPENVEEYEGFINLRDRKTHKEQSFSDEGVIITEKLAKLFDLQKGDSLTFKSSDNEKFTVQVAGIAEMYVGHYMYMTADYYESLFNEKVTYNTDLVKLKNTSGKWENSFAETLLEDTAVVNVTYANTISDKLNDTMDSLNIVVIVLIVSAALLAFVVLYNLSNINVSERIRELSTIKVLGFYPKEVTMYIYRENIFLTLLGIGLGYILGYFLHGFVIVTAEVDMMMISPLIHMSSYVYAGILTFLFSTIVMLVMHVKLKRIDMIEALKSVE